MASETISLTHGTSNEDKFRKIVANDIKTGNTIDGMYHTHNMPTSELKEAIDCAVKVSKMHPDEMFCVKMHPVRTMAGQHNGPLFFVTMSSESKPATRWKSPELHTYTRRNENGQRNDQ